jgi:hypothetical protein
MVPVWRNTLPDQIAGLAEMVLGACANAKRDPNQFRDRCPQERVSLQNDASKLKEQRPGISFARLCLFAMLAGFALQAKALGGAEFTYNSCVIDVPVFQIVGKGSGSA